MSPLWKSALVLLLVAGAAGQVVDGPDGLFDGLLKLVGAEGLWKWAWGLISEFGGPVKEGTVDPRWVSDPADDSGPMPAPSQYHHHDHDGEGHGGMHAMWQAVRTCHKKCGTEDACHEKCPKPWELMQKKCEDFKVIKACHKACHHDFECHKKCPMPTCERMAKKVQETLDCHGNCIAVTGGHDCHHACPKPLQHMETKCEHVEQAMTCRKACAQGDHECHHKCRESFPGHHEHGEGHRGFWHQHGEEHGEGHREHHDEKEHGEGHREHHDEKEGPHGWHHDHHESQPAQPVVAKAAEAEAGKAAFHV